jgi:predicted amidohydrolase
MKGMPTLRIALANLPYPASPEDAVRQSVDAITQAGQAGAAVVCFPECYVPGYRWPGRTVPLPDAVFLERAYAEVARAAAAAKVGVIVGTERFVKGEVRLTALVVNADGSIAGFQDKVQLDPSEDAFYTPGSGRHVFHAGPLCFGIAICHEGFRYPETVRWAARNGAHVVFHPHYSEAEPGAFRPTTFADPANSFHEKAALCRAAENTCYFATVNCAGEGSPTTSAVIRPDGSVQAYQPYGVAGLLVADVDTELATGLLAQRLRRIEGGE